ncbi:hypothetical protein Tco_0374933 [Tanacetum coccineum]
MTLKNSRPLPDFEEYAVSTSADTPYMILWSKIMRSTFSANSPYPKSQYAVPKDPNTPYPKSQYAVPKDPNTPYPKSQYAVPNKPDTPYRGGPIRRIQEKDRVDDDLHDLSSVEAEFLAIVINDAFTPRDALQCKFQVSTLVNDEIDFRISY